MAVRVIRARNTDPVVTVAPSLIRAAAYCRVSTDSEEQETSYERKDGRHITVEIVVCCPLFCVYGL